MQTLRNHGATIYTLVRRAPKHTHEITWHPNEGQIDAQALPTLDGVIHLAGENIAGGRWTSDRKKRIRDSRVLGTELLARTLAEHPNPPKVLISTSAIGYYGDRGDQILTEDSPPGAGFLPEVSLEWEAAAQPVIDAGIRTVFPRIGIVLTPDGGALGQMLVPFQLCLGGKIGSGEQYMSWVSLNDLIDMIWYALNTPDLSGPFNAVAPNPVTNYEFTKTLGRVMSRPTILPLPAFFARLVMGEMADALLLASTRVIPSRLQETDFTFSHPNLEPTLRFLLNR